MNFTYHTEGTSSYMLLELDLTQEEVERNTLEMLRQNQIAAINPILSSQKNSSMYIKYDVTGRKPAAVLFHKPISCDFLLNMLESILQAFLSARDYMLCTGLFELNPDYIYLDPASGEGKLIVYPFSAQDYEDLLPEEICSLLKRILLGGIQLDTRDSSAIRVFQQVLDYLNQNQFQEAEFYALLERLRGNRAQTGPEMEEGPKAYLEYVKDGSRIPITGPAFAVGKYPDRCQYVITDNIYISKKHITISREGQTFLLKDEKSRNGTWLNGKRLTPYEGEGLLEGDEILVYNEKFIFHLGDPAGSSAYNGYQPGSGVSGRYQGQPTGSGQGQLPPAGRTVSEIQGNSGNPVNPGGPVNLSGPVNSGGLDAAGEGGAEGNPGEEEGTAGGSEKTARKPFFSFLHKDKKKEDQPGKKADGKKKKKGSDSGNQSWDSEVPE